jgi:60 kDa SS-A/Ro ribonucleoprotein
VRTNLRAKNLEVTHEGATAAIINAEQQLRRSVMSCLLFEREFYEDGEDIAERIKKLAEKTDPMVVATIAYEARNIMQLRHVPLLLLEVLSRTASGRTWIVEGREVGMVASTVERVIQRADEMAEFIAIYTGGGDRRKAKKGHGRQFSAQIMRGLAMAFRNFDDYQLAKYDRDGAVKLKDVMRIVRPKPITPEEKVRFAAARAGTLAAPDTWEVALSGGADKKETFERLLRDRKLGYLALLRNLRNMANANVDPDLVREAILLRKGAARVLPFRFIAAARAVPQLEPWLDKALIAQIGELHPFSGRTTVLVDVSGSMDYALSGKSDLKRIDAAAALAAIFPGEVRLLTFSTSVVEVPPRRGMAGVDAIIKSQSHGGTYLGAAVTRANQLGGDRIVVISDEQTADRVPDPEFKRAYMINVASAKNGIGYGKWTHIDGFSENIFRFMREFEAG